MSECDYVRLECQHLGNLQQNHKFQAILDCLVSCTLRKEKVVHKAPTLRICEISSIS